ncbi:frizzled and smoothened-like protein [Tieghemostelium lacteum]|uniref:Frizzled and smoothened-like protein n=1 Tax=Tieghemostelium lacteum TaxID=361077 RepID=A0A152A9D4_TIELA|nr:frizzled and smoothened-like protein [Tieghemostelium lacteum]|eukprot:KYR02824.1 frizzled and smoothened-like protein [Tieghemostelium lacteum]
MNISRVNFIFFIGFLIFIYLKSVDCSLQSVVTAVEGQCEEIDPTTPCKNILPYTSIYIPNYTTQATIEAKVNLTFSRLSNTDANCKPQGELFACLRNYPPCIVINSTTPEIPLPSLPCNNKCEEMMAVCSQYVLIQDPSFSCSLINSTTGDAQFPEQFTTYDLSSLGGPSVENIQCNSGNGSIVSSEDFRCFAPLETLNKSSVDGLYFFVSEGCALPCPFEIFSESQTKALDGLLAFYILSFIGSTFLLITFGLVADEWSSKNEIVVYYALGNIIFCISYFIPIASTGDFRCSGSPGRYKSQKYDWICALDGVFLQYGALSMLFWFTAFSFDFFLIIRRIILTLVPLITKKYEITMGSTSCWISNTETAYQYIFFYVPSLLALVLMFIFTIYTIIKISKMYKVTPNKDILYFNVKMVIFIVLVLFVFVMFLGFKFYTDVGRYISIIKEWVVCLNSNQGDLTNCKPIELPGFPLKFVNALCVSTLGIIGFFGYGTDRSVYRLYRGSRKIRALFSVCGKNFSSSSITSSSGTPTTDKPSRRSIRLKSNTLGGTTQSSSDSSAEPDRKNTYNETNNINLETTSTTPTLEHSISVSNNNNDIERSSTPILEHSVSVSNNNNNTPTSE